MDLSTQVTLVMDEDCATTCNSCWLSSMWAEYDCIGMSPPRTLALLMHAPPAACSLSLLCASAGGLVDLYWRSSHHTTVCCRLQSCETNPHMMLCRTQACRIGGFQITHSFPNKSTNIYFLINSTFKCSFPSTISGGKFIFSDYPIGLHLQSLLLISLILKPRFDTE